MALSVINNVRICGISTVVPATELSLTDDKTLYGGNEKQLRRVMKSSGFDKRRIADKNTTTADLCFCAAKKLFENMKLNPEVIDALIFVSQTPDYYIPATSCILQNRLGLKQDVAVVDVNQGCSGYVYALWLASCMVNAGYKNILLLVGDTVSKFTDMFRETNSAPIFGDAGTATYVRFDESASPIFFDIGTDGSNFKAICAENGAFRNPPTPDMFYEDGSFKYNARMDGMKIMQFTLEKVPASIEKLLEFAKTEKNEVDYFILHQANKLILENVALSIDVPLEKVPFVTLSKYGNQSSASIPSAICDVLSSQVANGKLKTVLCGFGIGLTWASCLVDLEKIYCSSVNVYERK